MGERMRMKMKSKAGEERERELTHRQEDPSSRQKLSQHNSSLKYQLARRQAQAEAERETCSEQGGRGREAKEREWS